MEGLYYPCSENKGADQLHYYREADLRLYAKSRFFHDAAHMAKCLENSVRKTIYLCLKRVIPD